LIVVVRAARAFAVLVVALSLFWVSAISAAAQSPSPVTNPNIHLSAEPMLGGKFRAGSWAAFRVLVENTGPALDGDLRLARPTQGGSTFSRHVELAPGARQEHVLYAQMGPLTNRFVVSLVSAGSEVANIRAALEPPGSTEIGVFVVAERPEPLVGLLGQVLGGADPPEIVTVAPEQLPPRAEAWSAVDLLVWQDVDFNRLSGEHFDALRTWLMLGGDLVIVGGSSGAATLGALPSDLLPYQPAAVVDVPTSDLQTVLGTLPPSAASLAALAGTLERGTSLARSGSSVIAARAPVGQGSASLIGFDVSAPWIAESAAANPFWSLVFARSAAAMHQLVPADEGFIVDVLGSLPSVQVPPFEMIALLLIAYVVAIGPLNYFALRRRDRREWAWLTMPATIVAFAVGAYGIGVFLKGGEVVVNQLAVVYGASGSDRGLADVYVGVFSPSRATFDVMVGGNALLAAPAPGANRFDNPSAAERPVDVLQGDPAVMRGYSVGFGTLRGFRAQAAVPAPRIDSDLRLVGERLEGTIVNASGQTLSGVGVVYGNAVSNVADMAPGESRAVSLEVSANAAGFPLWERLVPSDAGFDTNTARTLASRRALLQHLEGGWSSDLFGGFRNSVAQSTVFRNGPVILCWQSGSTLDVSVGTDTEQVGERLYLIGARAVASGPAVFAGGTIQQRIIEEDNIEHFEEGGLIYLGRGTLVADFWPLTFDGAFDVSALTVGLANRPIAPSTTGDPLTPLPPDQQPDPSQPLTVDADLPGPLPGLPALQLYDRTGATWVEFEPLTSGRTYVVSDPGRYVDGVGTLRARFVVRDFDEFAEFSFGVRLEGTIE
jgi:hypothetical protein